MDYDNLVTRLRKPVRFAAETQHQARDRHFVERHKAADALLALQSEVAALTAELTEQARIIGMGAERELALRAELEAGLEKLDAARIESYGQGMNDAAKVADRHREKWRSSGGFEGFATGAKLISEAIRALASQVKP
jgi:predicted RNA-binding protein with PIN domain